MTKDQLASLFEDHKTNELAWKGQCHDCGTETEIVIILGDDNTVQVTGGAVYGETGGFIKCDACFEKDRTLHNFQEVECYVRSVGYLRPKNQFNEGKRAEADNRFMFDMPSYLD